MAWNFLLYYFNHSGSGSTGNGEGRKKERNERIHAPVDRGKRPISLSLSLPPSLFFIIPATYTYSPVSWTSRFRSNDCTPRQWAGGLRVSIPSPSPIPFFPLFSTSASLSTSTGKSFARETFSLSPSLISLLFHEARPRGWPVIVRIT